MTSKTFIDRRRLLLGSAALGLAGLASSSAAVTPAKPTADAEVIWRSTTEIAAWQTPESGLTLSPPGGFFDMDVMLLQDATFQNIEGFGGCFSELGGVALNALPSTTRTALMKTLFAPGEGLNLSVCRMPIGANDYARGWYSYNENSADFDMAHFDLSHDDEIQVPFIKAALAQRPDLKLWASPWSPPTWMKRNGHYAMAKSPPGMPSNGLTDAQVGQPGTDMFIQDERYFKAYALYFRRFVEAYAKRGIKISMVMPQNEFNSAQIFPSCCWTPEGLARFIPYLAAEMGQVGVEVFFGTLERGDPALFEKVIADPKAAPYIKGIGAQWAGKRAIPFIHYNHPDLPVYQSEQECGDSKNDWRYARYTWSLMKTYMQAGASVYDYWNIATPLGGESSWGWKQNALITVDMKTGEHALTHDYYMFRHLTQYIQPGAKRIDTLSIFGYDNLLAFKNPDGRLVVIMQNDLGQPLTVRIAGGVQTVNVTLPADSINTLVI